MIGPLRCPICSKSLTPSAGTLPEYAPFCSERCKQIDLLRWMQGKYRIEEPLSPDQIADEMLDKEGEFEE